LPDGLTSIGDNAFSDCRSLRSITIPAGVISIGQGVFEGCESLTEIKLPDSLEIIGDHAFDNCRYLTSITIPAGVISIGQSAFESCEMLTEIELPDGLESIGDNAFRDCRSLTSITIPAGVISIGYSVFERCESLTEIELPDSLESIGDSAFAYCDNLTSITIPAGVINIGQGVFDDCDNLTSISVDEGNSVYSSESGALSDGNQVIRYPPKSIQTSCVVPDGVTSIADRAFADCTNLTEIKLPAGLTNIGNFAFAECSGLTSIDIPESVISLGHYAFHGCAGLTSVVIPNGVTSITLGMFLSCTGLTSAVIPNSVTSIENRAFENCGKLTEIELPGGLTSIGYWAFENTGIKKISIPASLITVGLSREEGPFNDIADLSEIKFEHGMESFPAGILSGSLSNNPDVYIPMSIASGADAAGFDLSSDFTIHGVNDTYIIKWAEANGIKYNAVNGEIRKTDIEHAWLNVPYQYIIETGTYENAGLDFKVVGGTLPDGLTLLPDGQFHGAPLETGTFTFVVEVRYPVFDYLLDIQSIVLTVEEPAGYPGDIELFKSNDYPITDFVGESTATVDGVPVGYVLTYVRDDIGDRIFRVADVDINEDGLIDEADNNFPYFTDFWLDGKKLTSASAISGGDYGASEGSTVVTVYAKTFQNLDNGNHTVAAEFMIPDPEGGPPVQKVAAQKFTLELTDPPKEDIPPAINEPEEPRPENTPPGGSGSVQTPPAVTPPAEVSSAPARDNPFGDVSEGDWFYEDVLYAVENDLMNGTSAASFSPRTPMTRGMIITVLGRLAGADEDTNEGAAASGGFSDIEAGAYYTPYVAWAAANGLVSGTGAGGFAPNEDVTRQDLATLIARYAEFAGLSVPPLRPAESFDDDALTADYAKDALRALTAGGILNGKPGNIFDPRGGATRAEVAAILHRFIEATK
jgi:hypothetical protein